MSMTEMTTETPTTSASFWGPSLLLLGSSLGLLGCRTPGANVGSSTEPDQAKAQTQTQGSQAKAPAKRVRGFGIVAAELGGDGSTLRLEFSQPLGPTQAVDPNDFRLSMGMAYAYRMYAYAYYYDVGYAGDEGALSSFVSITADGVGLELTLNVPFPLYYCAEIEREVRDMQQEPGIKARGGLFLHYAPGEVPVSDAKGKSLRAVSPEWVLHARNGGGEDGDVSEMYFEGPKARRAFSGAIPVSCGPALPPGPR